MAISPLALRRFACAVITLVVLSAMLLAWSALSHQESTLAIRPVNQGASVPDGFSVWQVVLDRTLPHGYIIAQQEDDSQPAAWLSLIRDTSHRFG
ncbi:MAG: EnvZ/OmpR regulon moderator [Enterobacter sp.]|nr:EnvZ/OmpR regulon moderator [Enterobacter sp.]